MKTKTYVKAWKDPLEAGKCPQLGLLPPRPRFTKSLRITHPPPHSTFFLNGLLVKVNSIFTKDCICSVTSEEPPTFLSLFNADSKAASLPLSFKIFSTPFRAPNPNEINVLWATLEFRKPCASQPVIRETPNDIVKTA